MIPWKSWCRREPAELEIARFGMGRLVRCGTNRHELRGGDARDLAEAREWAAHFLHTAFIEQPTLARDRHDRESVVPPTPDRNDPGGEARRSSMEPEDGVPGRTRVTIRLESIRGI